MTKKELQEAFEQGLELQLEHTTAKIIQIIDNVYFISHNGTSNVWTCTIDRFKNAKVIYQNKYNGKAIKSKMVISFSDYCKEQGIEEPKWNQGFEVRDGYNDLVLIRDFKSEQWMGAILSKVTEKKFIDNAGIYWNHARLPKKDEFNINFAE